MVEEEAAMQATKVVEANSQVEEKVETMALNNKELEGQDLEVSVPTRKWSLHHTAMANTNPTCTLK